MTEQERIEKLVKDLVDVASANLEALKLVSFKAADLEKVSFAYNINVAVLDMFTKKAEEPKEEK